MFLRTDELKAMTETRIKRKQMAWLDANGLKYTVSTKGNINVLRKVVEQRHGLDEGTTTWQPPGRSVFLRT